MMRYWFLLLAGVMALSQTNKLMGQELITATPVRVQIPTLAAPPLIENIATPTLTRTPTPTAVLLEVKASAGEVNVRAEPDVESERLGTIRSGEFYPVLGRYFRWIQFQYDGSPNGRAWVFDELVDISGDLNSVPDLSEQSLPTQDAQGMLLTQTQQAAMQTPGYLLTITAESRIIVVPVEPSGSRSDATQPAESINILPTFTYPPDIATVMPTDIIPIEAARPQEAPVNIPDRVPPALPILLLGGGGLLGLAVSVLRR
jgi:hypothetical protein